MPISLRYPLCHAPVDLAGSYSSLTVAIAPWAAPFASIAAGGHSVPS
ncbi:MAG: hypothetical protein KME57_24245 [Scytonema hyalinum WJT4-NPBG1]|nr:hypothetical protein [Scytonema hyalinum WJT4-NPBG1]